MTDEPKDLPDDALDAVTGGGSGISSGIDYDQIAHTMGQATSGTEAHLRSFSQTMDPASSADMIKMQTLTQQWTLAQNLQSTTVKMVGDALKGIVQKVG